MKSVGNYRAPPFWVTGTFSKPLVVMALPGGSSLAIAAAARSARPQNTVMDTNDTRNVSVSTRKDPLIPTDASLAITSLTGNDLGKESMQQAGTIIVTSANDPGVVDSAKGSKDGPRIIVEDETSGCQTIKKAVSYP